MNAIPRPPAQIAELVDRIDRLTVTADAMVESYYANTAPGLMPFHLLGGTEERIRVGIEQRAADGYHRWFSNGDGVTHDGGTPWRAATEPAVVAYVPTLPGHRWPLRNGTTLHTVLDEIRTEPYCDLKLSGDVCESQLDAVRRILGSQSVAQYTLSLPMARGDLVIVARVCVECWKKFLRENRIKRCKTGVEPDLSDSATGVAPLDNAEHLWKGEHPRTRAEYLDFLREHPHAGPPPKRR